MHEEKVLAIIKRRLKIDEDTLDPEFKDYINQVGNKIKAYCNIRTIPEALIYVWASMVIDFLRIDMPNADFIKGVTDSSATSSFTIGKFSKSNGGGSSGVTNSNKATLNDIVLDYRTELNEYTRLKSV